MNRLSQNFLLKKRSIPAHPPRVETGEPSAKNEGAIIYFGNFQLFMNVSNIIPGNQK